VGGSHTSRTRQREFDGRLEAAEGLTPELRALLLDLRRGARRAFMPRSRDATNGLAAAADQVRTCRLVHVPLGSMSMFGRDVLAPRERGRQLPGLQATRRCSWFPFEHWSREEVMGNPAVAGSVVTSKKLLTGH
jgi:hypothetical protein